VPLTRTSPSLARHLPIFHLRNMAFMTSICRKIWGCWDNFNIFSPSISDTEILLPKTYNGLKIALNSFAPPEHLSWLQLCDSRVHESATSHPWDEVQVLPTRYSLWKDDTPILVPPTTETDPPTATRNKRWNDGVTACEKVMREGWTPTQPPFLEPEPSTNSEDACDARPYGYSKYT
jgi:hypothetical protein